MAWTIVVNSGEIEMRRLAYQAQVTADIRAACDIKSSQEALIARDDLKSFVDAIIDLAQNPAKVANLPVLTENGHKLKGNCIFTKGPYSIVFSLDSAREIASPILMFHRDHRTEQINRAFAYHLNGIR